MALGLGKISDFLTSETTGHEEEHSHSSFEEASASPPSLGWPVKGNAGTEDCTSTNCSEDGKKTPLDNRKLEKQGSTISEIELMKERFAKLLLGEDMSGCGNGFCTALAISNAITNICGMLFLLFCLPMWAFVSDFMLVNYYWFSSLMVISLSLPFEATLFEQIWRLEPVPPEKKAMWRREMEWLLSVSDHIVELIPSWQTFPDGSKLELYNHEKSLLDCLDLSFEHQAIEIANRVEASIYLWRKNSNSKPISTNRSSSKSSWDLVKDLMIDSDKREMLADRAESLLLCLEQLFPGLPQTTLDMSKIQYNKDVGKSILESYSRVLESLADQTYWSKEAFGSLVPFPSTPYRIAFSTPNFSPAQLATPAKGDRSPFLSSSKVPQCRMGVKKVLTDYLNIDLRPKKSSNPNEGTKSGSTITQEASVSFECLKAAVSLSKLEPVPEKEP
ncbi:hypothetical protein CXB51_001193 [Gossypium anomalum]|uniref:PRONE domain-containing protein n=1 Tax=Gossypium anomalum TaxID=47600 RepID=A0A8J5ZJU2_9ROSI|nr:hypothetical protein CXB51_001193 [Gossypium anomalum]